MSAGRARGPAGPDPLEALARAPLRPYYLLYGEETFLIERALARLRQRLASDGRPVAWRTVWGDDAAERLADALAGLLSPPLFGGTPAVVVRRADALREEEQHRVLDLLPRLDGAGMLVLVSRTADQRRKLVVACVKQGAAYGFPPVTDPREAAPWVVRLARERGREITPAAVQELLDRSGTELGVLDAELEKCSLHAGPGRRVEADHVRAVVTAVRAHGVEELTERLARRDVRGAALALRRLLAQGEPALRIAAFLAANLRRTLHVAELAERGLPPDDIARRLGMPPWLVAKSVGRGRAADLERALLVLRRLDLELKSPRPADAVFEAALLVIAGAA